MDSIPEDTMTALQDAGLTVYQARAYLTLLQTGAVRVLPLARASGVPRNKLYHVLNDLERAGLVAVVTRDPLEVRALPARPYLERRISRLEALLDALSVAEPAPAPARDPAPAPAREPAADSAPAPSRFASSHQDPDHGSASQQA